MFRMRRERGRLAVPIGQKMNPFRQIHIRNPSSINDVYIKIDPSNKVCMDFLFGHNVQSFMDLDFNEKSYDLCHMCTYPRR